MQKSAYIGFENETNYYQLHYDVIKQNEHLKIRKDNGALKRMLQWLEQDPTVSQIVFLDTNNKPYDTLYVNDSMVILVREQELITINLINGKVFARELDWWVNDDEDFKKFLGDLLTRNEIKFNDGILNSILILFKHK